MRDPHKRSPAPDFTTACVVMFGVNLTWILMVIWALWGLAAVALTGLGVNHLIRRIKEARG